VIACVRVRVRECDCASLSRHLLACCHALFTLPVTPTHTPLQAGTAAGVGAAGLTAAAVAGCQPTWPFDREKEALEATGARAVFMSLPRGAATALSHDGSTDDDAGAGAAVRPSALRCLLLCRALHLVADADVVLLGAPTDAMAEDEEARFFRALRAEVQVPHNAHHCLFRPCFHDCFHLTPPPPPHQLSVPPFHRLHPHRRLYHTPSWPRQASMGAGAGQRVVVVTASRLTAARHADRVIVVAPTAAGGGAAVAQCGTFAELLAQTGPFRDSYYVCLQERRMDDVEVPAADCVPRAPDSGNANGNGNGNGGEYFHSGGGGGTV